MSTSTQTIDHDQDDRRSTPRFRLQPGYTPVSIRIANVASEADKFEIEGHAYDISEGGVRMDADVRLEAGTPIEIRVGLASMEGALDAGRSVLASGRVAWVDDEADDPVGPFRCAATFDHFLKADDRDRLRKHVSTRRGLLSA